MTLGEYIMTYLGALVHLLALALGSVLVSVVMGRVLRRLRRR